MITPTWDADQESGPKYFPKVFMDWPNSLIDSAFGNVGFTKNQFHRSSAKPKRATAIMACCTDQVSLAEVRIPLSGTHPR